MGLNDDAWERLFDKYPILHEVETQGKYIISAKQIKEFREPRLMTKFDHKLNLPAVFRDNSLSILPLSRGSYVISSFEAYKEFEEPAAGAQLVSIPGCLQSLMPQFLTSEAIALHCAGACGILEDFLEEEWLVPTVSGQMGSGVFSFAINAAAGPQQVAVSSAQIEIDAAYEGAGSLSLFEAKNSLSKDFLIRQLYYPFRTWSARITKPVKTVFLVFSNGRFCLYQYSFVDPGNYNSLQLVKQKNYQIATKISLSDIESLLAQTALLQEPEIPFPQADSMARIINMLELLSQRPMTARDITSRYLFESRQTNYYTDAGRYLGLIRKEERENRGVLYHLTQEGSRIMSLAHKELQLALAGQILKHGVFHETLRLCLGRGKVPDRKEIVEIMEALGAYHVYASSTYFRRASTVASWIHWILSIIETERYRL